MHRAELIGVVVGHEESYVILSTVRTTKPGFLSNQSRTNVMLSRCKKGMVLVTNKVFVQQSARRTLLGKLAEAWGQFTGSKTAWIDWRHVLDNYATLPGSPAPRAVNKPLQAKGSLQATSPQSIKAGPATASSLQALPLKHYTVPGAKRPSASTASASLHENLAHLRLGTATASPRCIPKARSVDQR